MANMETTRPRIFDLRTFCMVTGASRGLGQRIAVRFAELLPAKTCVMLIARDADGLAATKALIEQVRPDVLINVWSVDLTDVDESAADAHLSQCFASCDVTDADFGQILLVHNAGSMGDISASFVNQSDSKELNRYWRLNLTSVVVLNSVFLGRFRGSNIQQRVVINISSLCAIQPFKSWSIYCSGKAARDMMFQSMALEEPEIRALNYAPGPLDTTMQLVARTQTSDPELKAIFAAMHAERRLLTCDQTLDRLIALLQANNFTSGSHVDYHDLN